MAGGNSIVVTVVISQLGPVDGGARSTLTTQLIAVRQPTATLQECSEDCCFLHLYQSIS